MGSKLSTKNHKLEKAIQARKLKLVKKWIRKGADPNGYSKKSNYSFLSMAITLREVTLVELLLKKGANPNQKSWLPISKDTLDNKSNGDDEYPIHIAAGHGSIKIMEALLNSEIDINKGQDHKQGTALHRAARFGHSKLAELLLANGADIIGIDSRLNIPIHVAATFGQVKVAEVLIQYGSPIDTLNIRKWTPLHYAASEGALSMVRLLLQHGAKPAVEDNAGHTPLALAKTEDMIRLFLEHAAEVEEINHTHSDSINITGPPKPTRTFAYSTRERSQSEALETTLSDLPIKKLSVHFSKSYADFGKWIRLQKANPVKEKVPDNFEHRRVRRTNSAPARKFRKNVKYYKPQLSNSVAPSYQIPNRSSSLHQEPCKKISVKKRSYSVRHRKIKQAAKQKLPENAIDIKLKPRRSNSTSALRSRSQYTVQTPSAGQQLNPMVEKEVSVVPSTDTRLHTKESISNVNPIPVKLGRSSRSLQHLSEITNETSESLTCDANHNIAPTKRVQRTKSEGRVQPKNRVKESWIDFHLVETTVSR